MSVGGKYFTSSLYTIACGTVQRRRWCALATLLVLALTPAFLHLARVDHASPAGASLNSGAGGGGGVSSTGRAAARASKGRGGPHDGGASSGDGPRAGDTGSGHAAQGGGARGSGGALDSEAAAGASTADTHGAGQAASGPGGKGGGARGGGSVRGSGPTAGDTAAGARSGHGAHRGADAGGVASAAAASWLEAARLALAGAAPGSAGGAPWADTIRRQLAPFSGGITEQDHLRAVASQPRQYGRDVVIVNRTLYVACCCDGPAARDPAATADQLLRPCRSDDRTDIALLHAVKAACATRVVPVRLFLSLLESQLPTAPTPLFYWSRRRGVELPTYPYWSLTWTHVRTEFEAVPWEARKPVALWRGSTSDDGYSADTWRDPPRARLVAACKRRPDVCDAGFTRISSPTLERVMSEELGIKPAVPTGNWTRYKYVVAADGTVAPSSRMVALLQTGSVLLKQESPYTEFYYPLLRPWEHYVPVAHDFSDLVDKVGGLREGRGVGGWIGWAGHPSVCQPKRPQTPHAAQVLWLRDHDDIAREIARRAQAFARERLSTAGVQDYYGSLLNSYAKLLRFTPAPTRHHTVFRAANGNVRNFLLGSINGSCPHHDW
jgi:hypothetical protein